MHHKTRLNAQNVRDPNVALSWENLELLCDACHEKEHGKLQPKADMLTGHVEL